MTRDWADFAACKGMDLDVWFPHYPSGRRTPKVQHALDAIDNQAKAVCATCPVRRQCDEWADTYPEVFGTWAGRTAPERARARGYHYRGAA